MIVNLILGIAEFALIIYMTYFFMKSIERNIYLKKRYYIIAFAIYGVAITSGQFTRNDLITTGFCALTVMIIGHFMFNKRLQYIFYYLLITVVLTVCQLGVIFGMSNFLQYIPTTSPWIPANVMIAVKIIVEMGGVRLLTFFVQKKELKSITKWQAVGLFLLPAVSIFYVFTLLQVSTVFIQLNGITLISVNMVLILILNFYFINISVYMSKSNELDSELKHYRQQNELQYQYYAELEKKYQDSRKVIHDMKNHLQAIEHLYDVQELESGNEYVKDMYHMLNILGEKYYTHNKMLNIILNDKLQSAERDGVETSVQIGDVDLDFMKDIDVTTIFANLLDNAVTAVKKASQQPYIRIKMDYFNEFIVISIRNSLIKQSELISGGSENTHSSEKDKKKRLHNGYGLQNVRKTLEKYSGTMQTGNTSAEFQVNITLPKIEEKIYKKQDK